MNILSFSPDRDADGLPEKPRPFVRFGCGDDVGSSKLTEEQEKLKALVTRVVANIDKNQKMLEARFAKPIGANELYDITDDAYRKMLIIEGSNRGWLGNSYSDERQEMKDRVKKLASLLAMARILKEDPLKLPNLQAPLAPGSWWSNEYKSAVIGPFHFAKLGLLRETDKRQTLTNIANIPSGVITYATDQTAEGIVGIRKAAAKGLGIPDWLIPVGIGALALAYVTNTVMQAKTLVGAKTT